ncbi:phosphoinositide 3-kinase adapter protein 1 isoform X1 [Erpetoichthys calabaricus]|uniref:phosphoinositide 3-kinase adapter protein 1 isoform X1 n=1 Tax=Erpetoichthys calabaricus TaxID=27687 RepID=UPI0022347892|nr:phosphoinositide 3-kinase adapter protein 1 isoform X1 [Erpetoichthys calabaricus]
MSKTEVEDSCDVLIVYTEEASEWSTYLQHILVSSNLFSTKSIVPYRLDSSITFSNEDVRLFQHSRCILLLMSFSFLDVLRDWTVLESLKEALCQPSKIVVLLCGVTETEWLEQYFQEWHQWKKLYPEDDPSLYITAVQQIVSEDSGCESITDSEADTWTEVDASEYLTAVTTEDQVEMTEKQQEREDVDIMSPEAAESNSEEIAEKLLEETGEEQANILTEKTPELTESWPQVPEEFLLALDIPVEETVPYQVDDKQPCLSTEEPQPTASLYESHVIIQPNRIRCGSQEKLYIILKCRLDKQVKTEIEFTCKDRCSMREPVVLENDYTASVRAPDMPPGPVSVTLYSGNVTVCSTSVHYYTEMEEISRCLLKVSNPVDFMCQAFSILPSKIEALDKLLTESLKKNVPASGLHLFGINQLEEENISAFERNEELPTLLHFSAKYGLKSLTALLLQCPGAIQAYSVANKYGEYPNSIAEKNGYKDLRQFMDEYVETADMLKSHIKEAMNEGEEDEVYETMSKVSTDILMKYSLNPGSNEEIYESMMKLNSNDVEDIYEDMMEEIPDPFSMSTQESILRKFLEGKSENADSLVEAESRTSDTMQEDPYKLCFEDVYDTVEQGTECRVEITNRPPAPIPRPSISQDVEEREPYISKVFSAKEEKKIDSLYSQALLASEAVRPVRDRLSTSNYDPFAGMKTPGQRQLISLQERVKMGMCTVDEALHEFKEWQLNQKKRCVSFKFQQENLKKLRDSISRRQKEKGRSGGPPDLEISAPFCPPRSAAFRLECGVYEPSPRKATPTPPPPPIRPIQRGNWQTGSTTSTSSELDNLGSASNRSSVRSNLSFSSGVEGDNEDNLDFLNQSGHLPHMNENPPELPPPRIPPRPPVRSHDRSSQERYVQCPTPRFNVPPGRYSPPPPIPRRSR